MAKRSPIPSARAGGELHGTAADKLQGLRSGRLQPREKRQAIALLRGTGVFNGDKALYDYLRHEGVEGLRFRNERIMVPALRRRPDGDTLYIDGLTRSTMAAIAKAVGGYSLNEELGKVALPDDKPVMTSAKAREQLQCCRDPRDRLEEALRLPAVTAAPLIDQPVLHATQGDPYRSLVAAPEGIRAIPGVLRALRPAFRAEKVPPTRYRYRENRQTAGLPFIVAERPLVSASRQLEVRPLRRPVSTTTQRISLTHEAWFAISPETRDELFRRPPKSEAMLDEVTVKAVTGLLDEQMDAVDQLLPVASTYMLRQQWPQLAR